jgi:hypothetical protein
VVSVRRTKNKKMGEYDCGLSGQEYACMTGSNRPNWMNDELRIREARMVEIFDAYNRDGPREANQDIGIRRNLIPLTKSEQITHKGQG